MGAFWGNMFVSTFNSWINGLRPQSEACPYVIHLGLEEDDTQSEIPKCNPGAGSMHWWSGWCLIDLHRQQKEIWSPDNEYIDQRHEFWLRGLMLWSKAHLGRQVLHVWKEQCPVGSDPSHPTHRDTIHSQMSWLIYNTSEAGIHKFTFRNNQ